jgi:hypothetical protein
MGLSVFLVLAFAVFHRKKRHPSAPVVYGKEQAVYEEFHCIKSSMKQVNENSYVAQLVFTNHTNVTLNAPSQVPRQISED